MGKGWEGLSDLGWKGNKSMSNLRGKGKEGGKQLVGLAWRKMNEKNMGITGGKERIVRPFGKEFWSKR